jgi:glycosyltransferase involved in cell wall biosynthesis
MVKKSKTKQLGFSVEIVAKVPYSGSGPRGVDVYATHLYNELTKNYNRNKIFLSKGAVGTQKVDLIHYTFFDPFFLTLWSRKHKAKYIVTVHDLIPLKFPAHFPVGIKGKLKWILQKRALLKASAIITDSECSKTDISQLTGISKDKIFVVKLAAGRTTVTEKMVKTVRTEYKLPDRYLLYVGDINWNKNVPGLIKAFAQLDSSRTHLVLVGKAFESSKGTPEYQAINQAIEESGKANFIHMLGFIPSHHLPSIYRGATLYIQPSWYEGFGFPILEAMEQGTPVASASTGSLPEVAGEYAHYFDPKDVAGMSAVMKDLLKNKEKREKYIVDAKTWARTFSWEKVAENTYEVYEKVVG